MLFDSLIALGSNLGERETFLNRAVELLTANAAVDNLLVSRWFATQPVGGPSRQGEFLNGAACFRTALSATELFKQLQNIEQEVGRAQGERWGPRVIDLDLLLHGATVLTANSPGDLIVPHPRMAFRSFVLEPAAEVAPDMRHPVIGWTIAELLDHLHHCPPNIGILSADASRARQLADEVSAATGVSILSSEQIERLGMAAWNADEVLCDRLAGEQTPTRPKLSVLDGRSVPSQSGPSLDISNLSREMALAEVVAAIEAMRQCPT